MQFTIEENVQLKPLTTLGITATASYLIRITDPSQLPDAIAFAGEKNLPIFPLGGGSNIVLGQEQLNCVALKIEIMGRNIEQTDTYTSVTVNAGENWDELVAWSVEQNLRGIESLSLIPGTVGAAPVQNIGAYGQELNQTVHEVHAYDLETKSIVTLSNADCHFSYRDSMFKHDGKHRYIVTAVSLRLVPADIGAPPSYISLRAELDRRGISQPTVAQTREAVIAVRRSKLPDPATHPTAGSFFHNPIVDVGTFQQIQASHPDLPHWPMQDGREKLAGAWMVEQCGFKGKVENGVGIYDKQALALINPGHRPAADVLAFRDQIIAAVESRFGVRLNMEPELITF